MTMADNRDRTPSGGLLEAIRHLGDAVQTLAGRLGDSDAGALGERASRWASDRQKELAPDPADEASEQPAADHAKGA
jgi:hypothetical protein